MTDPITILPVSGLGEVGVGDDLATLVAARVALRPGDVVVVAQKVVSKAEGALAQPLPGEEVATARRRIARAQARRVVADSPWALIVETAHGFVCANGGVDGSNAPDGTLVLLPDDPDASARRIRDGLVAGGAGDVAVVITDTFGRPWRLGQTDVAIGVAGIAPLRDERGGRDRDGRALEVTEVAVADEIAAAADLVRRKADGVPVVVVRGLRWRADEHARATDLVRPPELDLFAHGRGMLAAALADPPEAEGTSLDAGDITAARAAARAGGARLREIDGAAPSTFVVEGDRLGAGVAVAALLDLGCVARWREDPVAGLLVEAARRPAR